MSVSRLWTEGGGRREEMISYLGATRTLSHETLGSTTNLHTSQTHAAQTKKIGITHVQCTGGQLCYNRHITKKKRRDGNYVQLS